jgi:alanyl-tRNA synthetase
MVARLRDAERDLERIRSQRVLEAAGSLAADARDVGGVAYVAHRLPDGTGADDLRKLATDVRGRIQGRPAVVIVAGVPKDRPVVVVAVSDTAREQGLRAGALVGVAAKVLGGGGGGKDDLAQGGGSDPQAIGEALTAVERAVAAAVRAA